LHVAHLASRAEWPKEFFVPRCLWRPRTPWLGWVEQHRDLMDAAVNRPTLDSHDVGKRNSLIGRCRCEIVRRRRAGIIVCKRACVPWDSLVLSTVIPSGSPVTRP